MKEKLREWIWKISGAQQRIDLLESKLKAVAHELEFEKEENKMRAYKPDKYCSVCENAYETEPTYIDGMVIGGIGCRKKIKCENFAEKKRE